MFVIPVQQLKQGFSSGAGAGSPSTRDPKSWIPRNSFDFAPLIELVTSTVSPESWDEVGGPGSVREFAPNVLVVRQTEAIHDEIDALLYRLRRVARTKLEGAAKPESDGFDALKLFVYHFTGDFTYSTESLAELIPEVVARESWKPAGGKGTMLVQPTSLVIRQTPAVHKQIVRLLYDVVLQAK